MRPLARNALRTGKEEIRNMTSAILRHISKINHLSWKETKKKKNKIIANMNLSVVQFVCLRWSLWNYHNVYTLLHQLLTSEKRLKLNTITCLVHLILVVFLWWIMYTQIPACQDGCKYFFLAFYWNCANP